MTLQRRISIAPMMELTDRHYRYLIRLFTRHTLLYTEMLTSMAVVHGEHDKLLEFHSSEHPVALQLGGNDPKQLAEAAHIGEATGFDEINLNVGCPSDRVKSGCFGAALMAEPELVGQCIGAMQAAVKVPVTVKCRIGIDRNDSWDSLQQFVEVVADSGCEVFCVHARKAWLDGLSPKENRTIPPLRYDFVYRLKEHYPDLTVVINGGIDSWSAIDTHLSHVDGVMIGREAYYNPSFMFVADQHLFGEEELRLGIPDIARSYGDYMQNQLDAGVPMSRMSRHLIALVQGVPGARAWRRHLSSTAGDYSRALELVEDALSLIAQPVQGPSDHTADSHIG